MEEGSVRRGMIAYQGQGCVARCPNHALQPPNPPFLALFGPLALLSPRKVLGASYHLGYIDKFRVNGLCSPQGAPFAARTSCPASCARLVRPSSIPSTDLNSSKLSLPSPLVSSSLQGRSVGWIGLMDVRWQGKGAESQQPARAYCRVG